MPTCGKASTLSALNLPQCWASVDVNEAKCKQLNIDPEAESVGNDAVAASVDNFAGASAAASSTAPACNGSAVEKPSAQLHCEKVGTVPAEEGEDDNDDDDVLPEGDGLPRVG